MGSLSVVQSFGRHRGDVTDAQWAILEPILSAPASRADGQGRPCVDRRSWQVRFGIGNTNAIFQNGKLVTKAQFRLD